MDIYKVYIMYYIFIYRKEGKAIKFKNHNELMEYAVAYYLFDIREKKNYVESMNKEVKKKFKENGTWNYIKLLMKLANVEIEREEKEN